METLMAAPLSAPWRTLALAGLLGASAAGCVTAPSTAPTAAPSGQYTLDPKHASLIWRVAHEGGLSHYTARFNRFQAALDFDPKAPTQARLDVSIEAASVDTGNPDFDHQIADVVFKASQYPEIRFTSTKVEQTGANTARVTGNLTFHGATAPATLDVVYNGGARDTLRNADVIGFSATGTIDRTKYGADAYVNFGVGKDVDLEIQAELLKK
jgi:polyisoprenoid-binding protein YceI